MSSSLRRMLVVLVHCVLWLGGMAGALLLRFDGTVPREYWGLYARLIPFVLVVRVASFYQAGLFHGLLRYAGLRELEAVIRATSLATILLGIVSYVVPGYGLHRLTLPRSVFLLEWVLAVAFTGGLRLAVRMVVDRRMGFRGRKTDAPPVIMVGAGHCGELFLRDLERSPTPSMRVVAILDDDTLKHGSLLHGVRIVGGIDQLSLARTVEALGVAQVILAIPTAPVARKREVIALCRSVGVQLKTVPSLQDIVEGKAQVSVVREIRIEDLLRRDPVSLDLEALELLLTSRRVLITGAAGSIGSELVRQICRFRPSQIHLLDHNENGLFFLERELRGQFPQQTFIVHVASIRDEQRINRIFSSSRPHVVYHAAAHKHVPMMEANPGEAIRNNVLGTRVVADAAAAQKCDAFVLISTDKAVNPTSVMGTTKRIAEMYVQALASKTGLRFLAVRFGNVLGSAGSVVPIFRAAIERGEAVRVTHPDMRRYFMTIPEASQLVLQASSLGRGSEIFILDMGELVRIVDLARDLIELSGLRPDVDIPIEFTGMRPGEKLYEELLLDAESADVTAHEKIRVARLPCPPHNVAAEVVDRLDRLTQRVDDPETLRAALADIVPEARLGAPSVAVSGQDSPAAAPLALVAQSK